MMQPVQRYAERRIPKTPDGTFTFWFKRPKTGDQAGAWMLARVGDEAAFITAERNAPRVGERLELTPPDDTGVSPEPQRSVSLPRFGRVVKLYAPQGATRRVGIRFEDAEAPEGLLPQMH